MQEIVVLLACLYSKGCFEAREAYFKNKPEVANELQLKENIVRNALSPVFVSLASPVLATAVDRQIYFKVSRNVSVKLNEQAMSLQFVEEF